MLSLVSSSPRCLSSTAEVSKPTLVASPMLANDYSDISGERSGHAVKKRFGINPKSYPRTLHNDAGIIGAATLAVESEFRCGFEVRPVS